MWIRKENVTFEGDIHRKVEIPQFQEEYRSNRKVWIITFGVIAAAALIFTLFVCFTGGSTGVTVYDGEVRLTGANGFSVPLAELECTLLQEDLPAIEGYEEGSLQGAHTFADGREAVFAIESTKAPTICLMYNGREYYINCTEKADTMQLYQSILDGIEAEKGAA